MYTIKELNNYALEDSATKKRSFLTTLIEELVSNGIMKISNPISLYDNLLVGRKRSSTTGKGKATTVEVQDDEIDYSEEYDRAYRQMVNYL